MSFTDEDLKRLKEEDEALAFRFECGPKMLHLKALLARLEAAEKAGEVHEGLSNCGLCNACLEWCEMVGK